MHATRLAFGSSQICGCKLPRGRFRPIGIHPTEILGGGIWMPVGIHERAVNSPCERAQQDRHNVPNNERMKMTE
jgi:hypothetical protein